MAMHAMHYEQRALPAGRVDTDHIAHQPLRRCLKAGGEQVDRWRLTENCERQRVMQLVLDAVEQIQG
jgi:hypothetical protein